MRPRLWPRKKIRAAVVAAGSAVVMIAVVGWVIGYSGWFAPHRLASPGSVTLKNPSAAGDSAKAPSVPTLRDTVSRAAPTITEVTPGVGVAAEPSAERTLRLQVLNGCGLKGLAKLIAPALRAKGFDVRETRNAGNFHYRRSLVIDRTGDRALAKRVADSLGVDSSRVSSEPAGNLVDIDVTVVIGADFRSLRLDLTHASEE